MLELWWYTAYGDGGDAADGDGEYTYFVDCNMVKLIRVFPGLERKHFQSPLCQRHNGLKAVSTLTHLTS